MQRIFLIGYMGAGKTTIGEKLSERMGLSFIDLDHFIEKRYYKTVRQIFEENGEESFRETEKKALREVAEFEDAVISTGGGTPCFHENMAFMNSAGTTVYLKVPVDELVRRMEGSKNTRPVLKGRSGEALRQFMEASLSERSRYYEQAAIILDVEYMDTEADLESFVMQLEKKISS
jgi:shikimate kinase